MNVSVATTDAAGVVNYSTVPATKAITVHDPLRHTSGIGYAEITRNAALKKGYIDAGVFVENGTDYDSRAVTPTQEIEGLARAPLSTQPGINWEYGLSVDVLGRVVETASGMRLADFIDARRLKPLKMVDTGFQVPEAQRGHIAQPLAIDPVTKTPNSCSTSRSPRRTTRAARAPSPRRRTTCASPTCCCAAASSTASASSAPRRSA